MFNLKMSKKMKKFFSLMLVALVMLGVTACEQNVTIDTPKSEGLSFYAEIAMTRADLEQGYDGKWATVWEGNETLTVYNEEYTELYKFTNSIEEPNMFSCTEEGVENIVGQNIIIELTHGEDCYISDMGKKGLLISEFITEFKPTETISLQARNSFLRYTYNGEGIVTLSLEYEGMPFITSDIPSGASTYTSSNTGEQWVSFDAPDVTDGSVVSAVLSYSINGVKVKETTINLAQGKIYNLGMLMEPEVNEMFGIVGAHNSWNTESADDLYLIPNTNTYVRYNVTLAEGGFKFYGETTKTVIVEHPAVTTGEEGDWYLQPNSNWKEANARFAIYFYGNGETWVSMKDDNDDGIYVANNPTDGKTYPNMIFCRMNPSTTDNNWNNKWNQTGDLTCPTDGKNCFTVPTGSWDGATTSWSVHTPEVKDAWTEEVEEVTSYWIGNGDKNTNYLTSWATGWSNNSGENITVADTNKTYDIYFSKGEMQDWGFEVYYTVLESGSEAPVLK